jgi:hypothetical protein
MATTGCLAGARLGTPSRALEQPPHTARQLRAAVEPLLRISRFPGAELLHERPNQVLHGCGNGPHCCCCTFPTSPPSAAPTEQRIGRGHKAPAPPSPAGTRDGGCRRDREMHRPAACCWVCGASMSAAPSGVGVVCIPLLNGRCVPDIRPHGTLGPLNFRSLEISLRMRAHV